jgi:hypothetical protein
VVKGYGAEEESWLIAFTQIHGDPALQPVWLELDKFLGQTFDHESGQRLRVQCTVVDSGGAHTEHVYRYARARFGGGAASGLTLAATNSPPASRIGFVLLAAPPPAAQPPA